LTEKPQAILDETLVINDLKDRELHGLKWAAGSISDKFNSVLLNSVLEASWCPPGRPKESRDERYTMALSAMAAFKPQDEIEGMIAAQSVAMHLSAMECFRRAMRPDQPGDAAARLRKDGASLARGMVEMLAALDRKRGKSGNQVVRVEHVTVQPGGQAIVGNVAAAKRGGGAESENARRTPCIACQTGARPSHWPKPRHVVGRGRGAGSRAGRRRWRTVDAGCTVGRALGLAPQRGWSGCALPGRGTELMVQRRSRCGRLYDPCFREHRNLPTSTETGMS
jgi:hypothetical protein